MAVCVHHGPTVPFRLGRSVESSAMHRYSFGTDNGDKMLAELDDPNWVLAMAFMACMAPSGEYFAVDTHSM